MVKILSPAPPAQLPQGLVVGCVPPPLLAVHCTLLTQPFNRLLESCIFLVFVPTAPTQLSVSAGPSLLVCI